MTLVAWRVGRKGWTLFHVASFGRPLCGTPIPDRVQRLTTIDARPAHWLSGSICTRCREAVLKQEPAGSGQADGGPNGRTGQAGPVALEDTTAGRERAIT